MSTKYVLVLMVLLVASGVVLFDQRDARAGEVTPTPRYKVLDPIRHGNLTVFPVVAANSGAYPFVFFALMMVLDFFIIFFVYPETSGISLEQVQHRFGID